MTNVKMQEDNAPFGRP